MGNERASATMEYKAVGLNTLDQGMLGLAGLNQGLELVSKAFDLAEKAARAAEATIRPIVQTGSMFEQFGLQFETLLGSAAAAEERVKSLFDFASTTPFNLEQVVRAGQTMEAFGIFSEEALRSVGDAAAAFGKDLEETALAVAGAATGELERLKQFGITSARLAQEIGHEVRRNTVADLKEIADATIRIFEETAGGGMDRMSKSLAGMISNLQDSWTGFLKIVADVGVFDVAKGIVNDVLTIVNQLSEGGQAQRFGSIVGETISTAMEDVILALLDIVDQLSILVAPISAIGAAMSQISSAARFTPQAMLERFEIAAENAVFKLMTLASTGVTPRVSITGGPLEQQLFPTTPDPESITDQIRRGILSRRAFRRQQVFGDAGAFPGIAPGAPGFALDRPPGGQGPPDPFQRGGPRRSPAAAPFTTFPEHGELGPRGPGGMFLDEGMPQDRETQIVEIERLTEAEIEAAMRTQQAWDEARTSMARGFMTAFDIMMEQTKKLEDVTKISARSIRTAFGEGARASLIDWLEIEGRKAAIKAAVEGAAAAGAFASGNILGGIGHTAAAAKWLAVGVATGIAAGAVAGGGAAGDAFEGGGDAAAGGSVPASGTRQLSRTTGITTQTLTFNLTVIHRSAVVYGRDGVRELYQDQFEPMIQESIDLGRIVA